MQICRTVAGYSLGRADLVRRMMAKKKVSEMEKERAVFLEGAEKNGVDREAADKLFDEMSSFASYAFNKSHAAAYAVLAYRTAYLKAHYPCEYLAALMTSVLGNAAKTSEYISECQRYGIRILPPDINESGPDFRAYHNDGDKYIRFGLLALKNLGEGFVKRVIDERRDRPFTSFEDFVERLWGSDMNKRQLEALIKSGAFDRLGVYRSRLLLAYEKIADHYQERNRSNVAGQLDLFSLGGSDEKPKGYEYPDVPELSFREKLRLEKECSGMYFSGHLLEDFSRHIAKIAPVKIGELVASGEESDAETRFSDRQVVVICGIVNKRQLKMTKTNAQMAFLSVEDDSGEIEVVVFPKTLEKFSHLLTEEAPLCIVGQLSLRDDEDPKLLANSMVPLVDNAHFSEETPDSRQNSAPAAPAKTAPEVRTRQPEAPRTAAPAQPDVQRQSSPVSGWQPYQPLCPSRIYLRVDSADENCREFRKAVNLVEIFCDGMTDVIFYDKSKSAYVKMNGVRLAASPFVVNELRELLGEENVVVRQ